MQFILSESYLNKAVKKTKGTKYSKLFFPSHFTIMNILGFTYENSISMVEKNIMMSYCASLLIHVQ